MGIENTLFWREKADKKTLFSTLHTNRTNDEIKVLKADLKSPKCLIENSLTLFINLEFKPI